MACQYVDWPSHRLACADCAGETAPEDIRRHFEEKLAPLGLPFRCALRMREGMTLEWSWIREVAVGTSYRDAPAVAKFTASEREIEMHQALRALMPQHIPAIYAVGPGLLVTEHIPCSLYNDLNELRGEDELHDVLLGVKLFIDDLGTQRGWMHGDLHLRNILFRRAAPDASIHLFFIDFSKTGPLIKASPFGHGRPGSRRTVELEFQSFLVHFARALASWTRAGLPLSFALPSLDEAPLVSYLALVAQGKRAVRPVGDDEESKRKKARLQTMKALTL